MRGFVLCALVVGLAISIGFWLGSGSGETVSNGLTSRGDAAATRTASAGAGSGGRQTSAAAGVAAPALAPVIRVPSIDERDPDQVRARIEYASSMYDPAYLPIIAPYLAHHDAEVRDAAINGVVNLGDKAGAAFLRQAAKSSQVAEERDRMLKMADWLELPPLPVELIRKRMREAAAAKARAGGSKASKRQGPMARPGADADG